MNSGTKMLLTMSGIMLFVAIALLRRVLLREPPKFDEVEHE